MAAMPAGQAAGQQWSVRELARAGTASGIEFGRIRSLAVADDGRIFVLDMLASQVHVLSATGALERSIGRKGGGPGELSEGAAGVAVIGGRLVVMDAGNRRISVYRPDGAFVRSRPIDISIGVPVAWSALGDRLVYLARPMESLLGRIGEPVAYLVLAVDPFTDSPAQTLVRVSMPAGAEVSPGASVALRLDLRKPDLLLSGNGRDRLLLARTDTARVRVLETSGRTIRWIATSGGGRAYTGAEKARIRHLADSASRAGYLVGARAGARAAGAGATLPPPQSEVLVPERAPALTALLAGDRFLLVGQGDHLQRTPANWQVYGYDGKLLGSVRLPARLRPLALHGDRLYGVLLDELDVESVVILQLVARR